MMDSGLVTFFNVNKCGFYRITQSSKDNARAKNDVKVKGSLAETITLVSDWVDGREFSQTIPWDVNASPLKKKIYCKDIYKDENSNEMLFVFCRAVNNDKGALNGFIEDAKVGSDDKDVIKVSNKAKGKKLIYGEPMYYWFIPDSDLIVSINFPHSVASTHEVCDYFKKCIDNFIPTENRNITNRTYYNGKAGRDINIKSVNYRSDCDKYSMTYQLESVLKELAIDDVSLEDLAKEISHIVVRDTISGSKQNEGSSSFGLYNKVMRKQEATLRQHHVEITSEVRINKDELAGIIEVYKEEQGDNAIWNDVGFRSNGEDSIKWFDSYIDRKHIHLNESQKKDDSYYPAKVVFGCLNDQRESLLNFKCSKLENALKLKATG
jgi:hypothetical protein